MGIESSSRLTLISHYLIVLLAKMKKIWVAKKVMGSNQIYKMPKMKMMMMTTTMKTLPKSEQTLLKSKANLKSKWSNTTKRRNLQGT